MTMTIKNTIKNYMGRFQEGEEFSLGHMLTLSLAATIPLGIALWLLKFTMQTIYTIFW